MNRSLALVGLILVIVSILLVSIPFLVTSAFQVNDALYATGFLFLVGLVILVQAATSPDPTVTTVGGLLGNPVIDESRKAEEAITGIPVRQFRYAPGPKEPVNCRYCYTLIPWNILNCPRCARPRHCRNCGKQLYFLAGAIRCVPCVRDESQCNCPRVRAPGARPAGVRQLVRGP
jgi:hypothetical protein